VEEKKAPRNERNERNDDRQESRSRRSQRSEHDDSKREAQTGGGNDGGSNRRDELPKAAAERPSGRRDPEPVDEYDDDDDEHDEHDDGHDEDDHHGADEDSGDGEGEGEAAKDSSASGSRSGSRRRGRRGRGSRGGRSRSEAGRNGDASNDDNDDEPARDDRDRRHSFDADDLLFELASAREMIEPVSSDNVNHEAKIALFCDLENVALGVRDSKEVKKFDINLVLERLLEKGKIVVKKAYCDWERYSEFKRPFHEAAIEMIDIPQKRYSGKNSADIKMVVDAMDLSYSKEHVDTFVILSGDSDFSPLVSKLKENDKRVIGVGVKGASSKLLIANCDEFIYYEDVWRTRRLAPKLEGLSPKIAEAFALMVDAIQALVRENKTVLWGSMIKQTMQRKNPSFNEGYYGYGSFSELLEDAAEKKIVQIKMDKRAGSYIVTGFAKQ
jgi:uncharacterized protein (TIGR00288 family)